MIDNSDNRPVILIVDDVPTNIEVLVVALRTDYRIKVATSGHKALEIANNPFFRPDLILLDIMMPEMSGYEVCIALKQNPQTYNIPIIFVTAANETSDEEYGLKLGAIDYITKPYNLAIVKARVRNHIDLKIKTDQLERLAMIDGLIGIPNRRHFDELLEMEWKRAQRTGSELAVIMADIDYFKDYNDHYGHGAGDHCLQTVGKTLAESLYRTTDFVARYGGEEFIAIMPDTDSKHVHILAERWRRNIEKLMLPHEFSKASSHVTISVGFASIKPQPELSSDGLLEQADRMLYRAKEAGRNRVCGLDCQN